MDREGRDDGFEPTKLWLCGIEVYVHIDDLPALTQLGVCWTDVLLNVKPMQSLRVNCVLAN